jgi:dTDP-4-dehydrorhamnose 3,5-epimerase
MLKPTRREPTLLPEVQLFTPEVFKDYRGHFFESYSVHDPFDCLFVQDNESYSTHGVLRGMHFQKRYPQAKLVRVVRGNIWDVVIDVRVESPTFGRWEDFYLTELNHHQLFIPAGFAHGFLVLSTGAWITYKCNQLYYADDQYGVLFSDHELNIPWNDHLQSKVITSEQDAKWPTLAELRKELLADHGKLSKKLEVSQLQSTTSVHD